MNIPPRLDEVPDLKKKSDDELVVSYLSMRNLIGFSGILLPFILMLTTSKDSNDRAIESSISAYYYTANGDVLVVMLSVLGIFLLTYNGRELPERILTFIASICAIGVAFSPTASGPIASCAASLMSIHTPHGKVPMWFGIERHIFFAGTFFLSIALISLIYFPKPNPAATHDQNGRTSKSKRNRVYKICGWIILVMIVLLLVNYILEVRKVKPFPNIPVVFILEAIAIEAFGFAWITKGQTLWHDGEHYMSKGIDEIKSAFTKKIL